MQVDRNAGEEEAGKVPLNWKENKEIGRTGVGSKQVDRDADNPKCKKMSRDKKTETE